MKCSQYLEYLSQVLFDEEHDVTTLPAATRDAVIDHMHSCPECDLVTAVVLGMLGGDPDTQEYQDGVKLAQSDIARRRAACN